MPATIHHLHPETLFDGRPYGFTQIITTEGGSGKTVHLSGLVAWDPAGNPIGDGSFPAQCRGTLENLGHALKAVGATYDNVVHMRIFVVGLDEDKLAQVAEANKAVFSAEGAPTSTLIGVAALAAPDLAVEIEFDVVL